MSSSTHARHLLTLFLLSYQCTSELKKKTWFVRSLHCLNILLKYTTFSLFQSKINHKTSYHFVMSIHLLATMPAWTQYSSHALHSVKPVSLVYFESFQVPLYLGAQINYCKFWNSLVRYLGNTTCHHSVQKVTNVKSYVTTHTLQNKSTICDHTAIYNTICYSNCCIQGLFKTPRCKDKKSDDVVQ